MRFEPSALPLPVDAESRRHLSTISQLDAAPAVIGLKHARRPEQTLCEVAQRTGEEDQQDNSGDEDQ